MALLAVSGLAKSFGGVRAIDDVGFEIEAGMIFAVIGPNGAGKTSLFNVLSGFVRADRGSVRLRGEEVLGRKPHELVRLGLARSFQLVKPFLGMTVLETMLLPCFAPRLRKEGGGKAAAERATRRLEELGLADKSARRVDELNQGELRLLDIARALATEPDILLLDEPFSGLGAEPMARIAAILAGLRDAKVAVVIIEHRLRELMRLAEHVMVMNFGKKLAEGSPAEVLREASVIEAYLGTKGKRLQIFEIDRLCASYGGLRVLHDVSLGIEAGELVSIIGPNGAGKTSLLRAVSRLLATSGEIRLDGQDLTRSTPREMVARGVIHCPEGRKLFPDMAVEDNLRLGAFLRRDKAKIGSDLEKVYALFPIIRERRRQKAGTMSGGEQQMLAIGRALMCRPRILLLDEPSFGIAPLIVERIFEVVTRLNLEGLTTLLVEQNAALALEVAKRAYVLENGRVVLSGAAGELAANDKVRETYLGM